MATLGIILSLFASLQGVCLAHEYPNGFVERSLSIVVRNNVAYGEYSIGLNQATAESFLQKLDVSSPTGTSFPGKPTADEAKTVMLPKIVGEHLTDLNTIQRFASSPKSWFQRHLKIEINSKPVKIKKVQVAPASKHPFSILVKFQFLVASDSEAGSDSESGSKADSEPPAKCRLSIVDGLFPSFEGAVRQALKVKGTAMLLDSNVAPILVRAQRIEFQPPPKFTLPAQPRPSAAIDQTETTTDLLSISPLGISQTPLTRPPTISATILFAE